MKSILYVAANNGTDMRVRKELVSLAKSLDVTFLGMRVEPDCIRWMEERGISVNSTEAGWSSKFRSVFQLYTQLISLRKNSFDFYWVVDEQLWIMIMPLFYRKRKRVVLDIFDSLMLKLNFVGEKGLFIKFLIYGGLHKVVVTDENRRSLLPSSYRNAAEVIENYPDVRDYSGSNLVNSSSNGSSNGICTIAFVGTISMERGGDLVAELLRKATSPVNVICYGWLHGDCSELFSFDGFSYRGIAAQSEIHSFLEREADWLLCYYPPINQNNINASPNKIYDSLHSGVPVAINKGIKVSKVVQLNGWGIVYSSAEDLLTKISSSSFSREDLIRDASGYQWSTEEAKILSMLRCDSVVK